MISLPLSPFALLVFGVLFGGLGIYTLVRATPVFLETSDGALVFLVVVGVLFLGLAASALVWMRRLRAQGLGWMSGVTRDDA